MSDEVETKQKTEHVFGPYIVGFFDLLGQQDVLRSLNVPPAQNDAEALKRYKADVLEMYGSVYMLRKFFASSFSGFASGGLDTSQLTPEQLAMFEHSRISDIRIQQFSDTVVAFMPVRVEVNPVPLRSAFAMLGAAAITYTSCLYHGRLIRGAIEIGMGMELGENEIYGPVLSSVYNLEGKFAEYPRVVIGPELVKYINHGAQYTDETYLSRFNKIGAERCLEMLCTDDDGNIIVDYLGENFKEILQEKFDKGIILKGYGVVQAQLAKAIANGNTKLSGRYERLVSYYEARRSIWDK